MPPSASGICPRCRMPADGPFRPTRLLEPLTGARFVGEEPIECPQRQANVHDLCLHLAADFVKAIGARLNTRTERPLVMLCTNRVLLHQGDRCDAPYLRQSRALIRLLRMASSRDASAVRCTVLRLSSISSSSASRHRLTWPMISRPESVK